MGAISAQVRAVLAQPLVHARLDGRDERRIEAVLSALADEVAGDRPGAQDAVRHLLALALILVWRLSGPALRESQPLPRTIAQRFLHAVELHLRDHWTIARYAAEIGVTPDRLSAAIPARITGRSPLELVHARIVHEADALLDDFEPADRRDRRGARLFRPRLLQPLLQAPDRPSPPTASAATRAPARGAPPSPPGPGAAGAITRRRRRDPPRPARRAAVEPRRGVEAGENLRAAWHARPPFM